MNNLLRTLRYALVRPYAVVFAVILSIAYAIANALSIAAILPVLDVLFDETKQMSESPIWNGDWAMLTVYVKQWIGYYVYTVQKMYGISGALFFVTGLTLLAFFLKSVFRYASSICLLDLKMLVTNTIRHQLYAKMLNLPFSFHANHQRGDLVARFLGDVEQIEQNFLNPLVDGVKAPFIIAANIGLMMMISVKLTLFGFVVLPFTAVLIASLSRKIRKHSSKASQQMGQIVAFLSESLDGVKIYRIFGAQSFALQRFQNMLQDYYQSSRRLFMRYELASPISEFGGTIGIVVLIWYGGYLILEHRELTAVTFLGFIAMFYQASAPLKVITQLFSSVQRSIPAAQRIFAVLDHVDLDAERIHQHPIDGFHDKIVFENVCFGYDAQNPVIHNLSLAIPKGQMVAIVGKSGSGKSSLAKLLARMYAPLSGRIVLDGKNIQDIEWDSYYRHFGMVTQESVLFNDTIWNNIVLWSDQYSVADVQSAAQIAHAHDFIMQLPNGYQTLIGDAGMRLSGGQRQRLNIARAILKNPSILILDEATSALDTESERLVQQALEQLMGQRTSLVIAHRLSTILKADLIVVLDQGRIVEQGSYSELMTANGVFAQLVNAQGLDGYLRNESIESI